MTEQELQRYLQERFPKENAACEWKEFKQLKHAVTGTSGTDIASYISAIANMAGGHLVIGVEDDSLRIVGIQDFHDYTPENIRQRLLGSCANLNSEGFWVEEHIASDTARKVWVFCIPKHSLRLPVYAHGKAWQRLDDALVQMRPERLDAIINESNELVDWTAQTIPTATVDDLDLDALDLARERLKGHHRNSPFYEEIDSWETSTFLDKAKLSNRGVLTRAALLLLGKAETTHYLSPYPAQITWKLDAEERAYEHFGPPFLLATTHVLQRIRNVKYKLFPRNQLLATEVQKYDTRVILEALHNCLAHQDYTQNGRVLVTEKVDRLIFENSGGFFEGSAEDYFTGERTPSRYRNPWLAQAMVQLGMIDTMGYGIHAMILAQRKRFFPLPDFSKSTARQVTLEIYGRTLDENYSLLLMERQELDIGSVVLMDRVQKHMPIPEVAATRLRRDGLIEGRKPNYYVSKRVAATTDSQAAYTRNRGLDKAHLKQFVLTHLEQFKTTTREKLDILLMPMLPAGLTYEQKRNRVKNLLNEMRTKDQMIICVGRGPGATWQREA